MAGYIHPITKLSCLLQILASRSKIYLPNETYLKVLDEIATIPSGHCSEAKLEAFSNDSYDNGVK